MKVLKQVSHRLIDICVTVTIQPLDQLAKKAIYKCIHKYVLYIYEMNAFIDNYSMNSLLFSVHAGLTQI